MAETMEDVRGLPKPQAYAALESQLTSLLHDMNDSIAVMATLSCVLHFGFGHLWTGFYRRVQDRLVVGPYQGTLGCLEIGFKKGVCGTAWAERRTVVVPDVSQFPGHIACDARSRSEIVVPLFDRSGEVVAVLDIDSAEPARFDATDARVLESWVARFCSTVGG